MSFSVWGREPAQQGNGDITMDMDMEMDMNY
jgi:hypothetical protein